MKKIALLLFFLLLIPLSSPVFSQEEEDTDPTTTPAETDDKIEELKEKVAARVSELKKGKTSGLFGSVKSATDEAFILTINSEDYSIQLDEDAKVYSIDTNLRKREVKLSTFEKDTPISVIGTINEDEKSAVATVVVSRTPNMVIIGSVSEVSTKDGTITIEDTEGNSQVVDIEVSSTVNRFDAAKNAKAKIGLSAIEQGSNVIVYASPNEDETITASRVLILPDSFEVEQTPTPEEELSPTTKAKTTPTPTPEE